VPERGNPTTMIGALNAIVEMNHATEARSIGIRVDDREPEAQAFMEIVGAEIFEPRALDGSGEYGLHRQIRFQLFAVGEGGLLSLTQDGVRQIFDANLLNGHGSTPNEVRRKASVSITAHD